MDTLGIDIQVIVTGIVGLITTVASGFVSWLFAKKKYNAEVDSNVIENMKQSLEFYIKLSDDNKERLEEALKRNENLEREMIQLRQQIFTFMNNVCYNLQCVVREKEPKVFDENTASKKDISLKNIVKTKKTKTANDIEKGK